jgi:hypothetical protein
MTADEALTALADTLEQLQTVLPADKATWDADAVARLAVERLWITAGNIADEYRRAAPVDPGTDRRPNWSATGTAWLTPFPATCRATGSSPTRPPT